MRSFLGLAGTSQPGAIASSCSGVVALASSAIGSGERSIEGEVSCGLCMCQSWWTQVRVPQGGGGNGKAPVGTQLSVGQLLVGQWAGR